MPATIAPPPAKPSASTTPPTGANPIVSPSTPHEPATESFLGDIGSELEGLDQADETSKRTPDKPRDEKGKYKPADKPPEKPVEQEKPEEPEKPAEEPAAEEPKKSNIRSLGKSLEKLQKERDEVWQPKIQSLESKVKEYERTVEQLKTQQPDIKPFQEKLAAIEKENQALREVVRFSDFRQSPEFKEKYEQPYNEAWAKAVTEVTQLTMETEDGAARKATANDLLALANAPLDQLDELANKWFPRSAARVIRHVEKIRDLAEAQDKALEEAKKGATDFQTKRAGEMQKANQAFKQAYDNVVGDLAKKYPKWFAPDETDPKGNEILKKGFDYADTVFSPNGTQLTPEQKAARLAVIRAKAANHDRLASRLKSTMAERDELRAKLAEYEQTEPPTDDAGQPTAVGSKSYEEQIADEIKKLDR